VSHVSIRSAVKLCPKQLFPYPILAFSLPISITAGGQSVSTAADVTVTCTPTSGEAEPRILTFREAPNCVAQSCVQQSVLPERNIYAEVVVGVTNMIAGIVGLTCEITA